MVDYDKLTKTQLIATIKVIEKQNDSLLMKNLNLKDKVKNCEEAMQKMLKFMNLKNEAINALFEDDFFLKKLAEFINNNLKVEGTNYINDGGYTECEVSCSSELNPIIS